MAYSGEIYEAAMETLKQRKEEAKRLLDDRRQEVYERIPRIWEIARELLVIKTKAVQAVFDGRENDARMLGRRSLALQDERKALLRDNGYPEDYLTFRPHCEACGDEGTIGTQWCECFKQILREEQFKRSKLGGALAHQVFSTWNPNIYPPEQQNYMLRLKQNCEKYARDFSLDSPNLLFIGPPGTGKTFLSSCIANEVARKGFSVIYDSAPNIISQLEAVKFGRKEPEQVQEYSDCDLLIMDDLGAEGISTVSEAMLYNIVNGRIISGKPMIISTNLSAAEISKLYNERIASRLNGEFVKMLFKGVDLRSKGVGLRRTAK